MTYRVTEEITNLTDSSYNDWDSFNSQINLANRSTNDWIDIFESRAAILNRSSEWPALLSALNNIETNITWDIQTQKATRIRDWPSKEIFDFWYDLKTMSSGAPAASHSIISQEEV